MLFLTVIGLFLLFLAPRFISKLSDKFKNPIQKLVISLGLIFTGVGIFNGMFFYAEPGFKYHVRTIWGDELVIDSVGYNVFGFGRINAWKKAMTVQAVDQRVRNGWKKASSDDTSSAENNVQTSASLPPQNLIFLDQVDADVQATARFRLPLDSDAFLKLVHEYRTPSNFLNTALIPAFRETLQATGALMTAENYYSGGRTEFNTEFETQMNDGIYLVKRKAVRVFDDTIKNEGSANASVKGKQDDYGEKTRLIFRVEKQYDKDGQLKRKKQNFIKFGVLVIDARITDMQPNVNFRKRMELKQQASADRAIAREKRIQEEEQRLLAIAKGDREVAERQAQAKVNQIEKTTNAETDKQLAITEAQKRKESAEIDKDTAAIRLDQAKIDAEKIRTLAEAEAYKKEAILKADNALAQKLEVYRSVQQFWADAFAKRQVPQQIFGATSTNGTDSDVQTFLQLMTVKAAKDLSLQPEIIAK